LNYVIGYIQEQENLVTNMFQDKLNLNSRRRDRVVAAFGRKISWRSDLVLCKRRTFICTVRYIR